MGTQLPSHADRQAIGREIDRPDDVDIIDRTPKPRRWFKRFVTRETSKRKGDSAVADTSSLLAFASERAVVATRRDAPTPQPRRSASLQSRWPQAAAGVAAILVAAALAVVWTRVPSRQGADARPPRLAVDSRPAGAQVLIDGEVRGLTPLALSLTAGAHSVAVRLGGNERTVPLTLSAGSDVTQYFDMPGAPPPLPTTGRISVVTTPSNARVAIDGRAVGVSPLTVSDLTIAQHKVTVTGDTGSAERLVTLEPGATTSVIFSLPQTSPAIGGWLAVAAPFDVQVLEYDAVIGTSATTRIMIAAGRHDLLFVNRALDYHESRKIEVAAGKVTNLRVDPPKAALSVNARPWADVAIDGDSAGQTPLANLLVPIGTHEVVFRHPQYGERRQNIVITTKGPNRIAVDLTK